MLVRVATVGKPTGLVGRMTVRMTTDEPRERFAPGSRLIAHHAAVGGESGTEFVVDRLHGTAPKWSLSLEGVSTREQAEALRGSELFAEVPDDIKPTGEQEWFDRDLVGLPCEDTEGHSLGTVQAIEHLPAHELLVVKTSAGHLARVPFVTQIVPRVESDRIILDPPGGLLDPPDSPTD